MLVLAADLEKVEEVSAAGVDLDEVLILVGRGCRKGGCSEIERSGDVRGYLNGSHGFESQVLRR